MMGESWRCRPFMSNMVVFPLGQEVNIDGYLAQTCLLIRIRNCRIISYKMNKSLLCVCFKVQCIIKKGEKNQ